MDRHQILSGNDYEGANVTPIKLVAERRKDFDDKPYSGFLVSCAQQNTGKIMFVPSLDKIIMSVHVVCKLSQIRLQIISSNLRS